MRGGNIWAEHVLWAKVWRLERQQGMYFLQAKEGASGGVVFLGPGAGAHTRVWGHLRAAGCRAR